MTRRLGIGVAVGCLLLVLSVACCFGGLVCHSTITAANTDARYLDAVAPVEDALELGVTPDPAVVTSLCADRVTCAYVIDALSAHHRMDLVPAERASIEARGEVALARWLVYPTELDTPPSEMELAARGWVGDPSGGEVLYLAFRFRAPPGHWAEGYGWMFGISGPWTTDPARPIGDAEGTGSFSELEPYTDTNFRALVARIHEQVLLGRPISPGAVRVEIVPLD